MAVQSIRSLAVGELPQIQVSEFAERRTRLLATMLPNSICLIPAARLKTRSHDTEYAFRQDSDFHYLCGFPEPDALLVLSNQADDSEALEQGVSLLFCLPKDPVAEIWQGRRVGDADAADQFSLDESYPLDDVAEALLSLLDGHQHLYFAQGHDAELDELVFDTLKQLRAAPKQSKQAPAQLVDVRPLLHEMRLIKSPAEVAIMQRAAEISADAHKRAMSFAQVGATEYQLEAEIHHAFAMQGVRHPAYSTIVGSGDNACILHYTENCDALQDGDLVLIDAGAELNGYAADITRTFPVNGRFSPAQKQLYQLVLDAQLASLEYYRPGSTLKQAADKAIEVLTSGLIALGLLNGDLTDNIEQQHYRQFFMHGLGHWLGLDVHDMGAYKINGEDRPLLPGMVITIEPGLYIAADADVDEQWRGIGIRIEDNVLITESGYQVLTDSVPKRIDEIEALMAASC